MLFPLNKTRKSLISSSRQHPSSAEVNVSVYSAQTRHAPPFHFFTERLTFPPQPRIAIIPVIFLFCFLILTFFTHKSQKRAGWKSPRPSSVLGKNGSSRVLWRMNGSLFLLDSLWKGLPHTNKLKTHLQFFLPSVWSVWSDFGSHDVFETKVKILLQITEKNA